VKVLLPGGGSIRSSPPGIACPPTCTASLAAPVRLTAVPSSDYWSFGSWEGACAASPVATCLATTELPFSASVSFQPASLLQLVVTGAGRVRSSPPGIDPHTGNPASVSCSSLGKFVTVPPIPHEEEVCGVGYRPGEQVTLTAEGIGGMALQSWGWYACPGAAGTPEAGTPAAGTCAVTTAAPGSTVRAAFSGVLLGMIVEGRGTVTSTPAGIDCGTVCVGAFAKGASVRLAAVPQGSPFFQWSTVTCGTTPQCDVTPVEDGFSGASFGAPFHIGIPAIRESAYMTLGIGGLGRGAVTVTGAAHGSSECSSSPCSRLLDVPEQVTLTASPDPTTSRFGGWVAGCPPAPRTCTVDTQFVDSAALCFAPLASPQGIEQVTASRANGRRRLAIRLADLTGVKAVSFGLARGGVVRASWGSLALGEPPATVHLTVPKSLARGTYSLRAGVVDGVGCRTRLAPHPVVLPKP
jgi:hypothetical protein